MGSKVAGGPGDGGPDLEEPLLRTHADDATQEGEAAEEEGCSNYWACVFNLTKAVFGAGMMALPRACALLGSWVGFGMLGLVGAMTWFSVSGGLVHPAARLIGSAKGPIPSYSELVRTYLGHRTTQLLNLFLLSNALGFAVMYIDVTADVLVGSSSSSGVIAELLHLLQAPAWASEWLLDRRIFLALYIGLIVGPVSLQRNMASLHLLNLAGLAALAALGLSTLWLGGAALLQGTAHPLPSWPDFAALSSGGTSWVLAALSLLPVVLTSDGCHLNTMPLAAMMKPFSRGSMDSVVAAAMAICTAFYVVFATAAYAAFGDDVQDDVLKNLNTVAMTPILGVVQATVLAYTVRVAFAISLLGTTGLNNFPLREAVVDSICSVSGADREVVRDKYFNIITGGILIVVYLFAAAVPSIWQVIGFVGSISVTGVSFMFPAMMMFVFGRTCALRTAQVGYKAGAVLLFSVGLGILINGVMRPL